MNGQIIFKNIKNKVSFLPVALFAFFGFGINHSGATSVHASNSPGIITILGTVNLKGNLVNQSNAPIALGSGTFVLNGTSVQQVHGQNVFGNLVVNNASGIVLSGSATVNGTITLTNGLLTLGSDNLILGNSATIGGSPSSTSMVVATAEGQVRKSFSGAGSFTFPVGDHTGTEEYSPVTLTFASGTFATGNYAGVNLTNDQYPGSPATGCLKRCWNITESNITDFSCNAAFAFTEADVTGNENLYHCLNITPTNVTYYNAANTNLHQVTATALTSFGTFTGAYQFADKTLDVSLLLQGLYNGGGTMRKSQGTTGGQFAGNTADQVIVELHNQADYSDIIYTAGFVDLSTSGALTAIPTPGIHCGSYYITARHRNSIETTTAAPVSFFGSSVTYNFDTPAKAFGGNLVLLADGYYGLYGGDFNRDGSVDQVDMNAAVEGASGFANGYVDADANGDGCVDASDIVLTDNNSKAFVHAVLP